MIMENDKERQEAISKTQKVESAIIAGVEPLVLASASPRRAEILRAVGWHFQVAAANIDEKILDGESPTVYTERLAREKAEHIAARSSSQSLVLGADTIVVIDGASLGKPQDEDDARRMLRSLRGRTHEVVTGVALVRPKTNENRIAHERTRVQFAEITDREIDWYVATGEPMDKAGAYAVQGRAALFIERIDGDYWNVVGLPVRLVYRLAREILKVKSD
jgi:septum formation protein